ncbi:hypothetical protein DFJ74DRAFT_668255 [Hyaloraphidium curvatum]|nr:hypothetical protein DFJ74DRAFT_668255 [Hyaloraphidium curvatum]
MGSRIPSAAPPCAAMRALRGAPARPRGVRAPPRPRAAYSTSTALPAPGDTIWLSVVGSGPAGFYTADKILSAIPNARIDMFEALPIPHGLVRFGVAPDHPEVKNVMTKFDAVAANPRYRFVGNARLGQDYTLPSLRSHYHGVVLSYGASQDRLMGIPNEDARGVIGARAFVNWYNGAPQFSSLDPMLDSTDTAVIVGQGNVALDVARILLTPVDKLAHSDIAEHALEKLKISRVKRVKVVGRRGPLQVSFTAKELREMYTIPDVSFKTDTQLLARTLAANQEALANDRPRKRLMQLMEKGAAEHANPGAGRDWELMFLRSPRAVTIDTSDRVNGIDLEVNDLMGTRAAGTGQTEHIPCGLVFRSIGYKSVPVEGLPFDHGKGIVPNNRGRVLDVGDVPEKLNELPKDSPYLQFIQSNPLPGLYVAGWLKRGPVGVIASTMYDAHETAESIATDINTRKLPLKHVGGGDAMLDGLKARGVRTVSYADWKRLEAWEEEQGKRKGKPREKVVDLERALRIIETGSDT